MKTMIVAAISLDGFIAEGEEQVSSEWNTKADTKFFVAKTKEAGTVIMGRKTFDTFKRPLKDRRLIIMTSKPDLINVDGVEATNDSPSQLVERLEREGCKSVVVGGGATIYTQFVQANLVDELFISVIPIIFGSGVKIFNELLVKKLNLVESVKLEDNNTVVLHYKVVNQQI